MVNSTSLHRIAAAAVAALVVGVGALVPAHAGQDGGSAGDRRTPAASGHAHKGEGDTHRPGHGKQRPDRSTDRADNGKVSDRGQGDDRGNGHTPVTVCHLLGNGSYIEITFDDNALAAHQRHGDLYPVPAGGCPAEAPEDEGDDEVGGADGRTQGHVPVTVCHVLGHGGYHELTFDEHALEAHLAHGDLYPMPADGCPEAGDEPVGDEPDTQPDGEATGPGEDDEQSPAEGGASGVGGEVAGVQQLAGAGATGSANRTGPVTGPLAAILPQTGAAGTLLPLAAGAVLVGAGVTVMARRRSQAG